ncbi:hypothetical protein AJ80_00746 [Polytolypa hystricis UAMH7299]|uniref:Nicotinamide-nucleotide adenylyltransferase n=1 Tax=Polytolypa hystricis (strain UAMH7299) TaxID=1447883 RepID=A0A2B7Z1N2_POLH7|nr:hypothetical protein AJ80_00746 [Polytolypa hystricis UAMH7299]
MSETKLSQAALQSLRQDDSDSLHRFVASSESFQVLDSVPPKVSSRGPGLGPQTLYVLDSSFNPPTNAHFNIARSALSRHAADLSSVGLLLLLATQNADKPAKPAMFEDRLVMMHLFARDLRAALLTAATTAIATPDGGDRAADPNNNNNNDNNADNDNVPAPLSIDVGVTKLPYFIDKAAAIAAANIYPEGLEQIHLTGFDTLIRIFDPKYYPPQHTLEPLSPFLSQHRLRVTLRPDDDWGGREEQELFLRDLSQGALEKVGGRREWAQRIEFIEGKKEGEKPISSTKARNAVQNDVQELDYLVTPSIRDWMVSQNLYKES